MKLAAKLIAVTTLAILAIFAFRGYQNAVSQMALAEADARENAWLVGRALRPAVVDVWQRDGVQRAREVLSYARARVRLASQWDIRFVPVSVQDQTDAQPLVARDRLAPVWQGQELTLVAPVSGTEHLVTYMPVLVDGDVVGALEISKSMTDRDRRFRKEIGQVVQRTAIGAVVAILCIAVVGFSFVGRPVRRLVAKARRIGSGDLSGPLDMRQHDEIGVLAREMNEMCERLRAAQERVAEESRQRIASAEQLRHADRLTTVGKLASGVAHELGTPLNVVSGRAKMIVRGQVAGPAIAESAQTIVDQSERMTQIIKQLLGFARRRNPQRNRESLRPIAERVLGLLQPMAQKSSVVLQLLDGAEGVMVEADASLIEQALTNLVVNAIQAMPTGGTVRVRPAVVQAMPPADMGGVKEPYACIHVEDQGVGMTAEQLRHAFEPFFTTKDVGEGTGLGLSVAYGIIHDHSGWIAATSQLGKGSCFTIYLPLARESPQSNADDNPGS